MTLRSSDLQSDSDLDSIRNSCDVFLRKYDSLFKMLSRAEVPEVTRITGCQKPCRYNKYIIVGERRRTTFESKDFTFSLWAVSNRTEIRKEELIYPLSSLVADFGGTLGLFLGFSFMTLWDQIQFLGYFTGALKMCRGDLLRHTNWKVPYHFYIWFYTQVAVYFLLHCKYKFHKNHSKITTCIGIIIIKIDINLFSRQMKL